MLRNPWTAFFDWYKGWINDIRTTNHAIIVGCALAIVFVIWVLGADTFCLPSRPKVCQPVSQGTQTTLAFFIGGMVGFGVGQFAVKRATDKDTKVAVADAKARATTMMKAVDAS